MNDQDKEYLRDLAAMFRSVNGASAEDCYKFADEMMEARKPQEIGIKTVRKTRNYAKTNTNT